jgi:hypothetical protein
MCRNFELISVFFFYSLSPLSLAQNCQRTSLVLNSCFRQLMITMGYRELARNFRVFPDDLMGLWVGNIQKSPPPKRNLN